MVDMVDKVINYLWLAVFVTMVIAVAEKLSCINL